MIWLFLWLLMGAGGVYAFYWMENENVLLEDLWWWFLGMMAGPLCMLLFIVVAMKDHGSVVILKKPRPNKKTEGDDVC